MNYTLKIGWLYPDLMNTYGDKGNIIVLKKRCEWRGIDVKIVPLDLWFKINDLKKCDLLFMGGAQDRQQQIVANDLKGEKADALKQEIENGKPGLYICGAYQFLGKYYKEADGTIIPGLNILDLYTENPGEDHKRLIGNIVVQIHNSEFMIPNSNLVGFENHGGRTYLGKNIQPFGKVIKGFGNNGGDGTEGTVYKNTFGTYLHGPILPKNPHFADYLISKALEVKYNKNIELPPLDDSLEWKTHNFVILKKKD